MSISDRTLRALAAEHGTPLLVLDGGEIRARYRALAAALPNVALHYAIKALPHDAVVRALWHEGAGFDVASAGEIGVLRRESVDPRRCIHTHPIKKPADIKAALRFGCTTFVVDNLAEIDKFVPFRHRVALLLRLSFRSPDAVVDLSRKFGCSLDEVPLLLTRARQLGITIKGLSFHVGSQSSDAATHADAVRACAAIMADQRGRGTPLSVLDIGGGFPVDYSGGTPIDIGMWCAPLRKAMSALPPGVTVIAEPGRYVVASAVTGVFSVVGKALRGDELWYYLDDGVYGSFSGQLFDHARYPLRALGNASPTDRATIAGPTCDSVDVIAENIPLPALAVGDLVRGSMMGAYTAASATDFNALPRASIVAINIPTRDHANGLTRIA